MLLRLWIKILVNMMNMLTKMFTYRRMRTIQRVIISQTITEIEPLGTVTQLESSTEPLDDVFFPTVSNHPKVAYPQGPYSIWDLSSTSLFLSEDIQNIEFIIAFFSPKPCFISSEIHKVTICNLNQVTGSWFDEVSLRSIEDWWWKIRYRW